MVMIISLFFISIIGCNAFQLNYSSRNACDSHLSHRHVTKPLQISFDADQKDVEESLIPNLLNRKSTQIELDNGHTDKNVQTRRKIFRTLAMASCLSLMTLAPSRSLAVSQEDTPPAIPDTSKPFTVIFSVQTDSKRDDTSDIEIEVRPDWSPLGAERFRTLVESGFYKDSRFYRVLPGYVAQFGIAADPKLNKEWMFCEKNCRALHDEPRKESNKRGTLSFASSGKNSRQTQVFINLGNNDGPPNFLDAQNFIPFAKVVKGMDSTVKRINSEYGIVESVSGGLAGGVNQGKAAYYGAEYLDTMFPKLSIIRDARII